MADGTKSRPQKVTDTRRNEVVKRAAERERQTFRITPSQRRVLSDDTGRRKDR
jgi:hypothetical protein